MDAKTKLYCILGKPVSHSMSPAIHNAAFAQKGVNSAYVAFEVDDVESAVRGIRALGIGGCSVTIPHKLAVMEHLDRIDEVARLIGAVNTIVLEGDKLAGYNTDGAGAVRALKEAGIELKGKKIAMVGSGGAARAVAFTLAAREGIESLAILGIIEDEINTLVKELGKTPAKVEGRLIDDDVLKSAVGEAHLLINASPLGMHPDDDKTPVPADLLRPDLGVFDVVYNPLETRLLREARQAGCKTVPGVDMFLHQGVLQFEMWTGLDAPVELMRKIVLEKLGN